jgi:hypothetical protein
MTVMMLQHRVVQIERIVRGSKRWAVPSEVAEQPMLIQESGILLAIFACLTGEAESSARHGASSVSLQSYRRWVSKRGPGYGHIGRETARKAAAFGARILACTREGARKPLGGYTIPHTGDPGGSLPEAWFKTGDEASLRDFLAQCDVVVNCLPGVKSTERFVGREELSAMKDTAILVNVGRGSTYIRSEAGQADWTSHGRYRCLGRSVVHQFANDGQTRDFPDRWRFRGCH